MKKEKLSVKNVNIVNKLLKLGIKKYFLYVKNAVVY